MTFFDKDIMNINLTSIRSNVIFLIINTVCYKITYACKLGSRKKLVRTYHNTFLQSYIYKGKHHQLEDKCHSMFHCSNNHILFDVLLQVILLHIL